jgi:hypothetical protein
VPTRASGFKVEAEESCEEITCSTTAEGFESELQNGTVCVHCSETCTTGLDQSDAGWSVWGMGPFRIDSAICRAAVVAGILGDDGGYVTLVSEPSEPDFVPFGAVMRRTFCFERAHP